SHGGAAMERQFDLVVVGTGVTSAVATRCREAGWTVAVIDSKPFGGTCALRGCVPKKILVGATEAVQAARDLAGHGVRADGVTLAWPDLMRFKRSMVDPTPRRTEESWAKIGVEQFHGRARFVGSTMLALGDDRLVKRPRERGMRVELNTEVRGLDAAGGSVVVHGLQNGSERRFDADMAVHGAGRVPDIDDLDLDVAGVKRDKRGVIVNQFLQSVSNPAVYAGGDAAANGPQLTPKADHDALVLTENLLHGNHRTPNYEGFAPSVFTVPPLASTGLSEAAARARGPKVRVNSQ